MADHARRQKLPRQAWRQSVWPVMVLVLLVGSAAASLLAPVLGVEALEHAGVAAIGIVAGVHALRCFWNVWRSHGDEGRSM